MRKLASIQRVAALLPIENADAIELAQINGWQCVVKKGEFQVGDLGVYLEIDAIPPARPEFSFLWKGAAEPPKNLRIKTMRLRGALSQGLLLPLDKVGLQSCQEEQDVTELLGVTKYEAPVIEDGATFGRQAGTFPGDVPKTDEQRIQSMPGLLEEIRGLPYIATLKCDGTSGTYTVDRDGKFLACSRNFSIQDWEESLYWVVARRYGLKETMEKHSWLALQGEIVGPGIQKNRLGLKDLEFRAFNVYDKNHGRHLSPDELIHFCIDHNIPYAPIVERGHDFQHTVASLLQLAEGKYEGTNNEREGIVVRPVEPKYSYRLGGRLSFKAISNRYLLKGGE